MSEKNELNFVSDDTVYIHGGFDESISKNVCNDFLKLIEDKKRVCNPKIIVDIHSNGGHAKYLKYLLSIFDVAFSNKIVIETRVFSAAYSCGSLLACYGTKGSRVISKYAEHLVHLGNSGWSIDNNEEEARRTYENSSAHFLFVKSIYKENSKIKNLDKVINDDNKYYRGKEILEMGLADKFI